MASSGVYTLLPLDHYAMGMGIPGWVFNQVEHPNREYHGVCSDPVYQSRYHVDPSGYVGRDDIAIAIATAEQQIATILGYWPAPKWICEDEVVWPRAKRGVSLIKPILKTTWGQLISPGVEALEMQAPGQAVMYTDEDGDGVLDTGTVVVGGLYAGDIEDRCEVLIVPQGHGNDWRIRTVDVDIDEDTGDITITGPRWLFVDPDLWRLPQGINLEDDDAFVEYVDVYRHYNDTSRQAQIIWRNGDPCREDACMQTEQDACMSIHSHRNGLVALSPATYDNGSWESERYGICELPSHARMWYLAGYDDDACIDCTRMGPALSMAIIRLANLHLPAPPCGCDLAKDKWKDDREEQHIESFAVALAQRRLGTTARGAVFAMSVISSLEPLGKGG